MKATGQREPNTAQVESAMRFVLALLRDGHGHMMIPTHKTMRTVSRILKLEATPQDEWRAREDLVSLLEVAGFGPDGRIVDYERYYANREAWEKKRANKKRRRQVKA